MKHKRVDRFPQRSGQAIIFLLVVLVIGLLVVLWNFDLHNIVSTKVRVDNAGDAAALAAARWQGISLNMVGELNLVQAAYICEHLTRPERPKVVQRVQAEVDEIAMLRSRISLNGPLMGYAAAQSAAFMNLNARDVVRRVDKMSAWILERASEFQSCGELFEGSILEPYPGGWLEYGNLLAALAGNEMVVDCANVKFYSYYGGSHILLDPRFYSAVSARDWCYFKRGQERDLIDSYQSYGDWPSLPALQNRPAVNSEYFGLGLQSNDIELALDTRSNEFSLTNRYESLNVPNGSLVTDMKGHFQEELSGNYDVSTVRLPYVFSIHFPWHLYNMGTWMGNNPWPTSGKFPFAPGVKVREEYDYWGATAPVDCYIDAVNFTPGMTIDSDWIFWQAAAKPFGYLEDPDDSSSHRPPFSYGVVLPAFRHVRLIHNNLSDRTGGGRPGSSEHFYKHVPLYMEGGPEAVADNGCWYCQQLLKWEEASFREAGSTWLKEHQDQIDRKEVCRPIEMYHRGGGGSGGSGGSPMGRG